MPAAGAAEKRTQAAGATSSASEHGAHAWVGRVAIANTLAERDGSASSAQEHLVVSASCHAGAAKHIEATPLGSGSGGGGQSEGPSAAEHLDPADLSLDAIISSLAGNTDPEADKVRTAARELRDARGKDRKSLLRRLAALSDHIHVRQKLDGKLQDRKLAEVEADVKMALSNAAKDCLAGIRREARPAEGKQSQSLARWFSRKRSCTFSPSSQGTPYTVRKTRRLSASPTDRSLPSPNED